MRGSAAIQEGGEVGKKMRKRAGHHPTTIPPRGSSNSGSTNLLASPIFLDLVTRNNSGGSSTIDNQVGTLRATPDNLVGPEPSFFEFVTPLFEEGQVEEK